MSVTFRNIYWSLRDLTALPAHCFFFVACNNFWPPLLLLFIIQFNLPNILSHQPRGETTGYVVVKQTSTI